MDKLIIPCIYLEQEKAKTGFGSKEDFSQSNPKLLAKTYGNGGADELLVFDFPWKMQTMRRRLQQ